MTNLPKEVIIIGAEVSIQPQISQLRPILASKKPKPLQTCPICLKDSIFPLNAKKYCSKECSYEASKLAKKNRYLIHRQSCLNYARNRRKLNPNYQKNYNKIHKKRINEQRRLNKKIIKKLIRNKLIQNIRTRIRDSLKEKSKTKHTLELIGCTIKELKQHLESQFKLGMNWKNYGLWHIDHIRPCASFDFSKPEEQRKCFHYSNLQPLWAIDNLKKGAKYDPC